jgi:LuxR family transcriptional regulator, maltose regulon positive regulatory protein
MVTAIPGDSCHAHRAHSAPSADSSLSSVSRISPTVYVIRWAASRHPPPRHLCAVLLLPCNRGRRTLALDGALTLARVVQARGDPADALTVLAQAETRGHEGHVAQVAERVALARARLWLTSAPGDVAAAQRWASAREEAWLRDENAGDEAADYVGVLERLTLARLRLRQGRREEAARLLQRLRGRAEAGGLMAVVLEVLALQARLFLEQVRIAQAMLALSEALALAEPEGYVRIFVDEGPQMAVLLHEAAKHGIAPNYVRQLLIATNSAEDQDGRDRAPVKQALVEPLSERELEVLGLLQTQLSGPEIAQALMVSLNTLHTHTKNIYTKLGVNNRRAAVGRAEELHLL